MLFVVSIPAVAFLLKLSQLLRRPDDSGLRVVVLALGLLTAVLAASIEPLASFSTSTGPLLRNAAALSFSFLLIFFLIAVDRAVAQHQRRRATRRQLAIVLSCMLTMTTAFLTVPSAARPSVSYDTADSAAVITFFLTGNAYLMYANVVATVLATRHARRADRRVARGLRLAVVGTTLCAVVGFLRIVSLVLRGTTDRFVAPLDAPQPTLLSLGFVTIVAGLTLPALATRVHAARRWWWHFLVYSRLAPARAALADAVHGDSRRVPRWAFRAVTRRCYERVVECRDGLLRVSPYLAQRGIPDGVDDAVLVAAVLGDAVRDLREHRAAGTSAIRVLPPARPGLDAEVARLVELAELLAASSDCARRTVRASCPARVTGVDDVD